MEKIHKYKQLQSFEQLKNLSTTMEKVYEIHYIPYLLKKLGLIDYFIYFTFS
jgi:hypothetical protein